jgi:hypothetical protein
MMIFVELGCGEHSLAIERILNAVTSSRTALPVAIIDRLDHWLDGYVGSSEEPRLRTKLAEIRAQQLGSVGAKSVVQPATRMPHVASRRPTRHSVTR